MSVEPERRERERGVCVVKLVIINEWVWLEMVNEWVWFEMVNEWMWFVC